MLRRTGKCCIAAVMAVTVVSTTAIGFQGAYELLGIGYPPAERKLLKENGIVLRFRKGSRLNLGDGVSLNVHTDWQYGVDDFLNDGSRFKPKDFYDALGSDPQSFLIPYECNILKVNSQQVSQIANEKDLDDVPVVIIRARNGKVRVVYLNDGTTFWLDAEKSFPTNEVSKQGRK